MSSCPPHLLLRRFSSPRISLSPSSPSLLPFFWLVLRAPLGPSSAFIFVGRLLDSLLHYAMSLFRALLCPQLLERVSPLHSARCPPRPSLLLANRGLGFLLAIVPLVSSSAAFVLLTHTHIATCPPHCFWCSSERSSPTGLSSSSGPQTYQKTASPHTAARSSSERPPPQPAVRPSAPRARSCATPDHDVPWLLSSSFRAQPPVRFVNHLNLFKCIAPPNHHVATHRLKARRFSTP